MLDDLQRETLKENAEECVRGPDVGNYVDPSFRRKEDVVMLPKEMADAGMPCRCQGVSGEMKEEGACMTLGTGDLRDFYSTQYLVESLPSYFVLPGVRAGDLLEVARGAAWGGQSRWERPPKAHVRGQAVGGSLR